MIPGKIPWPGGPSMKQYFSLPSSIIYYMAKNPSSPEVYNKLIESCKYFFEQNPILVAGYISLLHDYGGDDNDQALMCSSADDNNIFCFDFEKVQSRFWLTDELWLDRNCIPASKLYSKAFRCDVVKLSGYANDFMFEDFKLLVTSAKEVFLQNVEMTCNNGKPVMLEKIVEAIPNIENFYYDFGDNAYIATSATIKNIEKLKNLECVTYFGCDNIPEVFEIKDLMNFITNHKNTVIMLSFANSISEGYKILLDSLIDTVIQSEVPNRLICYEGQDEEKLEILRSRYNN